MLWHSNRISPSCDLGPDMVNFLPSCPNLHCLNFCSFSWWSVSSFMQTSIKWLINLCGNPTDFSGAAVKVEQVFKVLCSCSTAFTLSTSQRRPLIIWIWRLIFSGLRRFQLLKIMDSLGNWWGSVQHHQITLLESQGCFGPVNQNQCCGLSGSVLTSMPLDSYNLSLIPNPQPQQSFLVQNATFEAFCKISNLKPKYSSRARQRVLSAAQKQTGENGKCHRVFKWPHMKIHAFKITVRAFSITSFTVFPIHYPTAFFSAMCRWRFCESYCQRPNNRSKPWPGIWRFPFIFKMKKTSCSWQLSIKIVTYKSYNVN